jgi:hypothetical protein
MSGVIVAGMHRSGTSLITSMLASGGRHPGDELLSGPRDEYFEDADFVQLHRAWLADAFASTTPRSMLDTHLDWGIADGFVPHWLGRSPDHPSHWFDMARMYAANRAARHGAWVAKDPRASLFLDLWVQIPDVRFVLVYRSPWDAVDSAVRVGADVFCRRPRLARRAWLEYNLRLLRLAAEHPDRVLLVAAEAVAATPEQVWSTLAPWAQLSETVPFNLVDPNRLVARNDATAIAALYREIYPTHSALVAALDSVAQVPRPGHGARCSLPIPPGGGTVAPETGIQVIIPCRDDGDFLAEAVASVEDRAQPDLELTIVDDGSTDSETLRVFDALRRSGRQVLRLPGVGLPAARNAAAATSRTAVVLPLDADNRVLPAMFEQLCLFAERDVDIVHGSWRRIGADSAVVVPPEMRVEHLVPHNQIDACALIRRRLLDDLGGWDEHLPFWEDWDLWLRVAARGARTRRVDDVLYEYMVRPQSLSLVPLEQRTLAVMTVERIMSKDAGILGRFDALRSAEQRVDDVSA